MPPYGTSTGLHCKQAENHGESVSRVEQGDEITINFHGHQPNNFNNTAARQASIQTDRRFVCACSSCGNPVISDAPRLIIRNQLAVPALVNATDHRHRNTNLPNNTLVYVARHCDSVCAKFFMRCSKEFRLANAQAKHEIFLLTSTS